jgi:hypothetical protein
VLVRQTVAPHTAPLDRSRLHSARGEEINLGAAEINEMGAHPTESTDLAETGTPRCAGE